VFCVHGGSDAQDLQTLLTDVKSDCEDSWKGRQPWVGLSELEAVNEKLELLLAHIARPIAEPSLKSLNPSPVQGAIPYATPCNEGS